MNYIIISFVTSLVCDKLLKVDYILLHMKSKSNLIYKNFLCITESFIQAFLLQNKLCEFAA